ncbi:hypothetical protein SAMN05444392_11162 [Seinonella peptonophila]|uniref:TcpE family protein n=1 Tax=Seinonella peptonophila TaxID=112248 RepID=A0A1M4ZZF1_9BACL|nr:hypothetical protein [Seinonella peptonophila]SHF23344.1 hypothetical protein SAMN05444392_11162 [Seinonella peptonophila]
MNREHRMMLSLYTEVNRLKQTFRHIEGIPIPLPVPITLSGIVVGVLYILLALQVPWGDPITKYFFLPLVIVCVVSYVEPDYMNPLSWLYTHIRCMIRPNRRVINRSVPPIGYQKEYRQPTIIRKKAKEERS